MVDSAADMDVIGLLLIAASLSLFLLPLGLIRQTQRGLHNPSMVRLLILPCAQRSRCRWDGSALPHGDVISILHSSENALALFEARAVADTFS